MPEPSGAPDRQTHTQSTYSHSVFLSFREHTHRAEKAATSAHLQKKRGLVYYGRRRLASANPKELNRFMGRWEKRNVCKWERFAKDSSLTVVMVLWIQVQRRSIVEFSCLETPGVGRHHPGVALIRKDSTNSFLDTLCVHFALVVSGTVHSVEAVTQH